MISQSRFELTLEAPIWEGLVIPGIGRGDPRIQVYTAPVVADLRPFVQSIWFMNWDIPDGEELRAIVVPTPCSHLMGLILPAISPSPIWHAFLKVKTKGEVTSLRGVGQSFGIEFRPGGLFPFLRGPVEAWPNGMLPLHTEFPLAPASPKFAENSDVLELWLGETERFFTGRLAQLRPNHLAEITQTIEMLTAPDVRQIDDILPAIPLSKRSLQRVFQSEVGVSPRDALRIARFHRSIKSMNLLNPDSLADFALESGYFDQPHLINEFRKLVDTNPSQFKKYW
jgi:AraC-like DNA-binding protein